MHKMTETVKVLRLQMFLVFLSRKELYSWNNMRAMILSLKESKNTSTSSQHIKVFRDVCTENNVCIEEILHWSMRFLLYYFLLFPQTVKIHVEFFTLVIDMSLVVKQLAIFLSLWIISLLSENLRTFFILLHFSIYFSSHSHFSNMTPTSSWYIYTTLLSDRQCTNVR